MVSVAGATPERWFRITCAFTLLTCAPNVRRPPPALRIWTVAVATVRLHMSRERTTFVVLTSRMGRLFKFPIGITISPDVEFAKRFCPSDEAMIFVWIASGRRRPSCGVRLDERITCNTLVACAACPGGTITPGAAGFCGLFGFSGLIAVCVLKVAYTAFPSTEKALPPLMPAFNVPARPKIVSVCVSNKNGPAMNREPSGDADTRGLKPDTLRLRNTIPEATSYTKIRLFGLMPACADTPTIRLPEAAVERLAKKFAGVFTGLVVGRPGGGVGGGQTGT